MKKILLIALLGTIFTSCGDSNEVTITKEEYNKLKGIKQPEYPKRIEFIDGSNSQEFVSVSVIDSCEYLTRAIGLDLGLLSHKGNCRFCQKRLEETIRRIVREELRNK